MGAVNSSKSITVSKMHMWLTNFNFHECKVLHVTFGVQVNIKNIASYSTLCMADR